MLFTSRTKLVQNCCGWRKRDEVCFGNVVPIRRSLKRQKEEPATHHSRRRSSASEAEVHTGPSSSSPSRLSGDLIPVGRVDAGEVVRDQRLNLLLRGQSECRDRIPVNCQQDRIWLIERVLQEQLIRPKGALQLGSPTITPSAPPAIPSESRITIPRFSASQIAERI